MKKSVFVSLQVLLSAAMLLAACGPAQTTAEPTAAPVEPTSAPVAATSPPTQAPAPTATDAATAQPAKSGGTYRAAFRTGCMAGPLWTTCGHRLDHTILQNLAAVKWTTDGVQPLLAESWEMQEGGKVWLIKLRKGVKWHDGAPFTADDVVFSFNAYANPVIASTWQSKVADILGFDEVKAGTADKLAGVQKIDDQTVRIELKAAQPPWMELTQPFIIIMPNHILGNVKPEELKAHPFWEGGRIGTGPFRWVEYKTDQYLITERNPDYYLGAPKLDRVIYQIYADVATILNALEKGEVDDISFEGGGIPETEVERMRKVPDLEVLGEMNAGLPTYIQWDLSKEPYSDLRFREAVIYAIDRESIIQSIFFGLYRPAYAMSPQEWALPSDLDRRPYNPEKARQLLQDMKYDTSLEHDFIYYYTDPVSKDAITAIQQQLAEVGIKIVPRLLNAAAINEVYADKSFQMGYFANGQGLDPSLGATIPRCGAQLALGYCNPTVDELFAKGMGTSNRAERAPIYQEINRILNKDLQKGYLWYAARPLAFSRRVVGLAEHWLEQPILVFNTPVYQEIEKWYVDE